MAENYYKPYDIRVEFAKLEDVSYWMEMVNLVRWNCSSCTL